MPPLEAEIAQSVAMLLEEGQMVRAVETTEFFVDVDKPWHILEANARLLDYLCARLEGNQIAPDARIHDGAEIEGRVVLGPGSSIGNRVVVRGDLFVGAHAQLTNGAILGGEGTGSFEEHLDALREVLGQAVGALEAELGERSFVGGVEAELSPLTELRGPLSGLKMKLRDKESMVFLYEDGREGQVTVRPVEFPALEGGEEEGKPRNLEALMDLELVISVELGRARMRIRDILQLGHGSIVELSKLAGEPVDLLVNGRKFAEGEVVVVDDNFGVRISSLVGPKERLGALS